MERNVHGRRLGALLISRSSLTLPHLTRLFFSFFAIVVGCGGRVLIERRGVAWRGVAWRVSMVLMGWDYRMAWHGTAQYRIILYYIVFFLFPFPPLLLFWFWF
jgi:hypothetical protein